MKETDIRPDELMQNQAKFFAEDVEDLLKNKQDFIEVPCPACGSQSYKETFIKYGMDYVTCQGCSTLFINPRPTPQILEKYYENSKNYQYWNKFIFPTSENARREKIFRPRAERLIAICDKYNITTDFLLEVGAGYGTFIEETRKRNIFKRLIAIEPTPDLANTCRKKGIETIEKPVEKVNFNDEKVDVIASFEVIEHLFSPRDFITKCASILSSGGILILTCPNVQGFEISVLQKISNSVDVEHLNYFNPSSLSQLVQECGLDVLELTTPGKLDAELVRKKVLSGEFDISSQSFLKQVLIDDWDHLGIPFQKFLAKNSLSSHMWLVAQKKRNVL